MSYIEELKSITPVSGNWYRIKGSKQQPLIEKVVLWAVLKRHYRDEATGEAAGIPEDIPIGIVAGDLGVSGNDSDAYLLNVAGYIERTQAEYVQAQKAPETLNQLQLVWE